MPSTRSNATPHKWQFEALGTPWLIETPTRLPQATEQTIQRRLEVYDQTYSRFRDDSMVHQLRKPGKYQFTDDFTLLFDIYMRCYDLTAGQMSPLIGAALEDAGYDADYRLAPRAIGAIPSLEQALRWDGAATLTVKQPIVLDVGAAGKGYAVDLIADILTQSNVTDYVIDASGDMRQAGPLPEIIGLEHPFDATKVIGTIELHNQSLCASASNRRAWGEFHHVLNAKTGRPEQRVIATWVVADTALVADAVATALFFVDDTTALLSEFDVVYVRLLDSGTLDGSPGFGGELFI